MRPQTHLVAHEGCVTDVLVRAWAASLDHEIRHDAMERQTVVEARCGQMRKTKHRGRRLCGEQRELEGSNPANGDARAGRSETTKVLGVQIGHRRLVRWPLRRFHRLAETRQ